MTSTLSNCSLFSDFYLNVFRGFRHVFISVLIPEELITLMLRLCNAPFWFDQSVVDSVVPDVRTWRRTRSSNSEKPWILQAVFEGFFVCFLLVFPPPTTQHTSTTTAIHKRTYTLAPPPGKTESDGRNLSHSPHMNTHFCFIYKKKKCRHLWYC